MAYYNAIIKTTLQIFFAKQLAIKDVGERDTRKLKDNTNRYVGEK